MKEINRPKGEGLLRKMFAENRKIIRDLDAIDISPRAWSSDYTPKMRSNLRAARSFRSQVSQIPTKSSRLNDQCFDFGERNRSPMEYLDTKETSSYFQKQGNQSSRQNARNVNRSAPYPVSVQNRAPKREWAERSSQSLGQKWNERSFQSMTISFKDETGSESRSIWENKTPPTNSPNVAPFRSSAATGAGANRYSTSFSSSRYHDDKNTESSYQNSHHQSNSVSRYGNTFNSKLFNKEDMNGNSTASKWSRPTNFSQYNYEDQFDDFSSKELATKKWDTPQQLNPGRNNGEFYAELCNAVFEKVIQLLHPDTLQGNQKSSVKSQDTQRYAANGSSSHPAFKTSTMRDNPYKSEISQRSDYPEYNRNYSNADRREYTSKPSFDKSSRGRGAGRGEKRKFIARN